MVKKVEFIMQDNVDLDDFIWALNTMCSEIRGMLQYKIVEEKETH